MTSELTSQSPPSKFKQLFQRPNLGFKGFFKSFIYLFILTNLILFLFSIMPLNTDSFHSIFGNLIPSLVLSIFLATIIHKSFLKAMLFLGGLFIILLIVSSVFVGWKFAFSYINPAFLLIIIFINFSIISLPGYLMRIYYNIQSPIMKNSILLFFPIILILLIVFFFVYGTPCESSVGVPPFFC